MKEPTYRWVCSRCDTSNPPGVGSCESCGCPANVSATDLIVPEEKEQRSKLNAEQAKRYAFISLMSIPVTITLASPIWAISLVAKQHYAMAAVLLSGAGAFGYAGYRFLTIREKFGVHVAMVILLAIAGYVLFNTRI